MAYQLSGEEFSEQAAVPLLGGKAALVFATRDAAARSGLLERVWLEGVFAFCGIRSAAWLAQVGQTLLRFFPPAQDPGKVAASSSAR